MRVLRSLLRPKTSASLVIALVGAVFAGAMVERNGDPVKAIAGTEKKLEELPGLIKRHKYQLKPFKAEKPSDPQRTLFMVTKSDGRVLHIEGPSDSSADNLKDAAKKLLEQSPGADVMVPAAVWEELYDIWAHLSSENKEIAKAKAMLRFSRNPSRIDLYEWEYRFGLSKRPWKLEESSTYYGRRFGYGIVAGFVSYFGTFLLLSLLGWIWGFFLDRIRELARAIRGQ
jgi:hypothetical protein